ncbi:putative holliday junction resolvase [Melghirimyces thermohalophilus]|uniref:Putative pre-16S rRNA nuclease n=1 Tax=Melghirimyces thermohalophilus TaxID=1236220 RepID=A0A1G6MZF8_9BACL|nr:Holliday junction resolvase RuvX [Melghirimyces thermohalophilus]SDC60950.1 putative holliday junction resolvase [Melghirimyces thermohalophilus]
MKRIMGLDVGEKRMGVAISDPMGWTAQGVDMVRRDQPDWLKRLQELIEQYEVDKLVVGLPRNMDGSIGEKGQICQELSRQLEERFSIPVELWDERLSTVAVERTLIDADMSRRKRRKVIDQMAASWILQGYLDAQRRNRDV